MSMQRKSYETGVSVHSGGDALLGRLIAGMSGQVFSRLIVAAANVIWVPLMLRAWGAAGYGEWIAVTALASYLSYSNFGFVTPAANEIVMLAGAQDLVRAQRQVRMAVSFCMFVVFPILVIIAAGLSTLDFQSNFHFTTLTNPQCAAVIAGTALDLMGQTLLGIVIAPLYAKGVYGRVYFTLSIIRLAELLVVSALLSFWLVSPPTVAWTIAAVTTIIVVVMAFSARRIAPWVSFRPHNLNAAWISQQVRPTMGFMLYNLARQGILVLAPRALLSVVSGGGAVAVYALYSTIMRLVDQVVWVFLAPLEVEMARSAGSGDLNETTKLIRMGTHGAWLVFIAVSLAIAIFAPLVFPVWTQHKIVFEYQVLALAGVMFGCSNLGKVSAHALVATNRLYGPSFLIVAWSVVALGLGVVLAAGYGANGMFLGGILGELGVSVIAVHAVARWLAIPVPTLLFDFSSIRSLADLLRRRAFKL